MSELNLGNLKINQLGYVYKDIKKQAKIFEYILNSSKPVKSELKNKFLQVIE